MTESEWLEGNVPYDMIRHLRTREISDRKWRLAALAEHRRIYDYEAEVYRDTSWVARAREWDRWLESPHGPAPVDECWAISRADAVQVADGWLGYDNAHPKVCAIIRCQFGNPFRPAALPEGARTPDVLALARAANEQRLGDGTLDPFLLGLLADALEDAGCPAEQKCAGGFQEYGRCYEFQKYGTWWEDRIVHAGCGGSGRVANPILAHLRPGGGTHYRGCWALDLALGRS